jgi:hypothetical protein
MYNISKVKIMSIQITLKIDGHEFNDYKSAKKFIDKVFSINSLDKIGLLNKAIAEAKNMSGKKMNLQQALNYVESI